MGAVLTQRTVIDHGIHVVTLHVLKPQRINTDLAIEHPSRVTSHHRLSQVIQR